MSGFASNEAERAAERAVERRRSPAADRAAEAVASDDAANTTEAVEVGTRPAGLLGRTPSQTIGPFFAFALPWPDGPTVVPEGAPDAIEIRGRLTDGSGDPVPDALIEIWQADPDGHFDHPADPAGSSFRGFGRAPTDADGRFRFVTMKPGRLADGSGALQAPHIDVSVFARGLLTRLVTRIYFEDEAAANEQDPILALVGDPEARGTLLAKREDGGYHFDIRLQGDGETTFFDL